MIRRLFYVYRPAFITVIVYMLQSTEYSTWQYLKWLWRTDDFSRVMHRKSLDRTRPARLLSLFLLAALSLHYVVSISLALYAWLTADSRLAAYAVVLASIAPFVWAHLICLPLFAAKVLIINPKEKVYVEEAGRIFKNFKGPKIAVAGSYGKTTAKELLLTVLAEGMNVAGTPDNKNVLVSHARFAKSLSGEENALVIEYGEGRPGDVARFTQYTQPTHVVVTGIAPAHLDEYKSLDAVAEDILSSTANLSPDHVFGNGESAELVARAPQYTTYSRLGVGEWKISDIKIEITGMSFVMQKQDEPPLHLETRLVGEHLVGVLAAVVAIANELGLSSEQIVAGVAKTAPYPHRMNPYPLQGAWVIDDSYNGNIDGIQAGTALLASLPAKRKIYVTPGLVEQGDLKETVHQQLGEYIATAEPDMVVLMKNSVTQTIMQGLHKAGYAGEVRIEDNPLEFYTNIAQFVAAGDIIMLQNDWTDNYA
jgi:UDP-N-acetylmuramoyl-tripeptide--D-alanyl-D-alanine ligase